MHPSKLPEVSPSIMSEAASEWSAALVNGTRVLGRDEVQSLRTTGGDVFTGAVVAGSSIEDALEIANAVHMQHFELGEARIPVSGAGGVAVSLSMQLAKVSET